MGPLTLEELVAKNISPETLVWKEGMQDWQPAWKVDELHPVLDQISANQQQAQANQAYQAQQAAPDYTAQPAQPNAQYAHQPEGDQHTPNKPKSYLFWKIIGGLFILLLIIMIVTNPKKDEHVTAIRTEVSKAIDKSTSGTSDGLFEQGFKMIARMMAGNVIDSALDQLFEYHNYILFSKGTVTLDNKEHTVSYGVFGKVITMNADDMVKAFSQDTDTHMDESSNSSDQHIKIDAPGDDISDDEAADQSDNSSSDDESSDVKSKLEDKASKAVDKIADKASKKMEEKINKKLDEVSADSSTIQKLIDKIIDLF